MPACWKRCWPISASRAASPRCVPGPVVTLYEFEPAAGVKSSRVISLSDDVARSMSAVAARIATISGRNVIGIELPNQFRETVYLREMFASSDYEKARAPLTLALGKTIGGEPVMADLAKMPHLAGGGHHRLGQVGRPQHHDPVAALSHVAAAVPPDHDRSQDAGIVGL